MSHDEPSVLGKRTRKDKETNGESFVNSGIGDGQLEDDGDDIGPMPMSDTTDNGVRKKRKGTFPRPLFNLLLIISQFCLMKDSFWTISLVQTGTIRALCTEM